MNVLKNWNQSANCPAHFLPISPLELIRVNVYKANRWLVFQFWWLITFSFSFFSLFVNFYLFYSPVLKFFVINTCIFENRMFSRCTPNLWRHLSLNCSYSSKSIFHISCRLIEELVSFCVALPSFPFWLIFYRIAWHNWVHVVTNDTSSHKIPSQILNFPRFFLLAQIKLMRFLWTMLCVPDFGVGLCQESELEKRKKEKKLKTMLKNNSEVCCGRKIFRKKKKKGNRNQITLQSPIFRSGSLISSTHSHSSHSFFCKFQVLLTLIVPIPLLMQIYFYFLKKKRVEKGRSSESKEFDVGGALIDV